MAVDALEIDVMIKMRELVNKTILKRGSIALGLTLHRGWRFGGSDRRAERSTARSSLNRRFDCA